MPPRRSSRLRKKKRVNYGEDALWYRALGAGKSAWNEMIEIAADDPPPQQKPWQKKKHFQKKVPKPKPKKIYRMPAQIEVDEKEIDFDFAQMEDAQGRVDRIVGAEPPKKEVPPGGDNISRKRKHLLFMNPGDEPIQAAMVALNSNQPLPAWARPFRYQLGMANGRLTWTENNTRLPFAFKHDKRRAVKKLYFDPREPATILPIASKLYKKWANINRRNVRVILQSLETYQLNKGRRRPPDIKNRMFLKGPGMLAMDMFFPSVHLGWEKTNVLCCMALLRGLRQGSRPPPPREVWD